MDTCYFCGMGEDVEPLFRSPAGYFLACQECLSAPGEKKDVECRKEKKNALSVQKYSTCYKDKETAACRECVGEK